jgi:uncharacterized protein with GYD domain
LKEAPIRQLARVLFLTIERQFIFHADAGDSCKEVQMPKYLTQVNYVGEGIKGLLKEGGTSRRDVVEKLIKSVGGTMEAFYYAFGETDLFILADMPDNASMAAVALTASASGTVTVKTTVLLAPEELDDAGKKSPLYRALK